MIHHVPRKGFCPTLNQEEYNRTVAYVENFSLNEKMYEKGVSTCPFVKSGGKCDIVCPIDASAPLKVYNLDEV